MLSFKEFLSEYTLSESQKKIDYLIKNTKPEHQHLVTHAYDADPTKGKHTEWILNRLKNNDIHPKNLQGVTDNLNMFEKYKNKAKQKDIHKHTIDSLHSEADYFRKMESENPVVHETEHVRINSPKTYEASKFFYGKKGSHCETSWCTADDHDAFRDYKKLHVLNIKQGPLKGKAFQTHSPYSTWSQLSPRIHNHLNQEISDDEFNEVAKRSSKYFEKNKHLLSDHHKMLFTPHTDDKEIHGKAKELFERVNHLGGKSISAEKSKQYRWPEANLARRMIRVSHGSSFHKNNQELYDSVKTKMQKADNKTIKSLAIRHAKNNHKTRNFYKDHEIFNDVIRGHQENTDTFNSLLDHDADLSNHVDTNPSYDTVLHHALKYTRNKNNLTRMVDKASQRFHSVRDFKSHELYDALVKNPHHGKEIQTHIENVFRKPKKED